MKSYLQVLSGNFDLLFEVEKILEVLDLELHEAGHSHYSWRSQLLEILSLRKMLELSPRRELKGIVYESESQTTPTLLKVDQVIRLREVQESNFLPLPPLPKKIANYFNQVLPDPQTGLHIYRCQKIGFMEE